MARVGEVIETAIWITGEESPEDRKKYEHDVARAIDYFCYQHDFTHGPVVFTEKHPMDDRVPEVPDHIQGQRVRLLVAESVLLAGRGSFVANLEFEDLKKLRSIIRKYRNLTDEECDEMIEELGVQTVMDTIN